MVVRSWVYAAGLTLLIPLAISAADDAVGSCDDFANGLVKCVKDAHRPESGRIDCGKPADVKPVQACILAFKRCVPKASNFDKDFVRDLFDVVDQFCLGTNVEFRIEPVLAVGAKHKDKKDNAAQRLISFASVAVLAVSLLLVVP
ncbi:Secreted protein [Plasmodiophora brassicae]